MGLENKNKSASSLFPSNNFFTNKKNLDEPVKKECAETEIILKNISFVYLNNRVIKPIKIITYDVDGTIFDFKKTRISKKVTYICSDKIREVKEYASKNNIMIVLLTARPRDDYTRHKYSPRSAYQIAKNLFGENQISFLIFTNDIFNGKKMACDILWERYFNECKPWEKSSRICLLDDLEKNIESVKDSISAIKMSVMKKWKNLHAKV